MELVVFIISNKKNTKKLINFKGHHFKKQNFFLAFNEKKFILVAFIISNKKITNIFVHSIGPYIYFLHFSSMS